MGALTSRTSAAEATGAGATPSPGLRIAGAFEVDLRSLALLRILLGCMILVDLAIRAQALADHYSDAGLLPRAVQARYFLDPYPGRFSLHMLSGDVAFQGCLFALAAVFAVLLMIGYRTRVFLLLSWLLLISLHNRNELIETGGDYLLRLTCFWALFMPLGARWSVDRARGRACGYASDRHVSLATFAFIAQMAIVYVLSAVHKDHAHWRVDFLAIHYALHIDAYATPLGIWMRQFGELNKLMTKATLLFEFVGPFFVFACGVLSALPGLAALHRYQQRVRMLTVLAFMWFHFCLGAALALGTFPWFAILVWTALIPTWAWDHLGKGHVAAGDVSARPSSIHPAAQVLAALCLFYVGLWNLRTVDGRAFAPWVSGKAASFMPDARPAIQAMRLDQHWGLFAPYPRTSDGWYVIVGKQLDGGEVDLQRPDGKLTWRKPKYVSFSYPTFRWRKYFRNIRRGSRRNRAQLPVFTTYLCNRFNDAHAGDTRIRTVDLYFMRMKTQRRGGYRGPDKRLLWHRTCQLER